MHFTMKKWIFEFYFVLYMQKEPLRFIAKAPLFYLAVIISEE